MCTASFQVRIIIFVYLSYESLYFFTKNIKLHLYSFPIFLYRICIEVAHHVSPELSQVTTGSIKGKVVS